MYLLIAYMKYQLKTKRSLQQILRLLQMNLFEKWLLDDLMLGRPPEKIPINPFQLSLMEKITGQ